MRLSWTAFAAAAVLFFAPFATPAESFKVNFLRGDNIVLLGIDQNGSVLVDEFNGCSTTSGSSFDCYEQWTNGAMTYRGNTAPAGFVADNGSPCAADSTTAIGSSSCNNGFHVWGESGPGIQVRESYPGSDSFGAFVYGGTADGPLFVNRAGDFATLDGIDDYLVEVQVSSAPEPSSFALLGTGLLGIAGVMKRRLA